MFYNYVVYGINRYAGDFSLCNTYPGEYVCPVTIQVQPLSDFHRSYPADYRSYVFYGLWRVPNPVCKEMSPASLSHFSIPVSDSLQVFCEFSIRARKAHRL